MNNIEKRLILGTALWGWGVSKKEAFLILDNFVENGGLYIEGTSKNRVKLQIIL